MHADEFDIDSALVYRLVSTQFPQWASLAITPVRSTGTDNAMFLLGEALVARLPRVPWAADQVGKEQTWLPKLAPLLPMAIPTPVGKGEPDAGYPWEWSVLEWIDGETASLDRLDNPCQAASDLARFVLALQTVEPTGGPLAGDHNSGRGLPLARRDDAVRSCISQLEDTIDTDRAVAAWEKALKAPPWEKPPVWIHGDIQPGNLIQSEGRIKAVIDFGCLGVGDPACDLLPAWNFFAGDAREVFRTMVDVDDATWERGRGWALSVGIIALPYYRDTNPALASLALHTIEEVLSHCD